MDCAVIIFLNMFEGITAADPSGGSCSEALSNPLHIELLCAERPGPREKR